MIQEAKIIATKLGLRLEMDGWKTLKDSTT